MSINVGGVSPGNIHGEQPQQQSQPQPVANDRPRIDAETVALEARRQAANEARREAEEKQREEQQKNPVAASQFVMSETDMKELLVLMGSRGNPQTVEKMVEGVKRLKEQTDRRA